MTREEAIEWLQSRKEHWEMDDGGQELAQALEMGIEALEQEPCEDCISRQAVNILVDELARAISDERCCVSRGRNTASIMQDILDLPPAAPQPKTGHWIDDEFGSRCSCCDMHTHLNKFGRPMKFRHCSMCGAKMVEPQENKDIELVIKIPEEMYDFTINARQARTYTAEHYVDLILKGTPLPKGHGRLGDLDELEQRISNFVERDAHITDEYTVIRQRFIVDGIRETPTIIEADKEE